MIELNYHFVFCEVENGWMENLFSEWLPYQLLTVPVIALGS